VLSKKNVTSSEKGKDADIKKWESELRKSLAQKKAAEPTLSKQEKALIDTQLSKESATRSELQKLQRNLQDGLALVRSVLASKTDNLRSSLAMIASLLMNGVVKSGSTFIGQEGVMTFMVSGNYRYERS
jgi:hypothetical protein